MGEKLISAPSNNLGLSSAFLPGSLAAYNLNRAESDVILVARMTVEMVPSRWFPRDGTRKAVHALGTMRELRPCRTMRGEKWRHQRRRQAVSNLVCLSVLDFNHGMAVTWWNDAIHGQSECRRPWPWPGQAGHRAFWSPTAAELSKPPPRSRRRGTCRREDLVRVLRCAHLNFEEYFPPSRSPALLFGSCWS